MRQRHTYSKFLKAQVIQECQQPGISVSSVALRHGINANVVRRWLPSKRNNAAVANLPAFVPLPLAPADQAMPEPSISIDIPYEQGVLTVRWPASDPAGCARFVRGLTR
ncbi:IS66-like element accessory protein TnpA [Pseudomonas sp. S1(2024)]|uniref:IS66-like element accessory protein TnpA n=1 Tax=Pseudomonas sp. S1(2024) TaxID=3390191 RepID=UPI00397D6927